MEYTKIEDPEDDVWKSIEIVPTVAVTLIDEMRRPHVIVIKFRDCITTAAGVISLIFFRSVKIVNFLERDDLVNFQTWKKRHV